MVVFCSVDTATKFGVYGLKVKNTYRNTEIANGDANLIRLSKRKERLFRLYYLYQSPTFPHPKLHAQIQLVPNLEFVNSQYFKGYCTFVNIDS